jgi:hypothetical protein
MGGGFQEKPVNVLGDVGCACRFRRRAIFALGLFLTTDPMSPMVRADPARNGGCSLVQLADHSRWNLRADAVGTAPTVQRDGAEAWPAEGPLSRRLKSTLIASAGGNGYLVHVDKWNSHMVAFSRGWAHCGLSGLGDALPRRCSIDSHQIFRCQ